MNRRCTKAFWAPSLVLLSLCLLSCQRSFTGQVSFKTTIVSNDGNSNLYRYYYEKYGDSMVIDYRADGSMKRKHYRGKLDYQKYSPADSAVIFQYHNGRRDTFPCHTSSLIPGISRRLPDRKIIGTPCRCYERFARLKNRSDTALMRIEACYPKYKWRYRLRPELYTGYRDYFIHELFAQNKRPYFSYYIHYPEISILYEAVAAEAKRSHLKSAAQTPRAK